MYQLQMVPIDPEALRRHVAAPSCGAVVLFLGDTRDHFDGRLVQSLEYEAYAEMAIPVMKEIGGEIQARWPGARVAMIHRLGAVPIGETSVVIAVATPHRDAAYKASRYAIDELKQRVPIWKKEIYDDGSAWKANAAR